MSLIQQVERLLPLLSLAEKARVLRQIAEELDGVSSLISLTPGVCGGAACVAGTRIPVWLLEQARQEGVDEPELLRWYPSLRSEHVQAAWAYAEAHREEVERLIKENEAA